MSTSSPLAPIDLETLDLQALADEAHENSRAHGFWDQPPSIERSCNLMHSEVSELLEDLRAGKPVGHLEVVDGKPVGPASELADVAIRLLDFAGGHRLHLAVKATARVVGNGSADYLGTGPDRLDFWVSELHREISDLSVQNLELVERLGPAPTPEGLHRNSVWLNNMGSAVTTALALVDAFARAYDIPLWAIVRQKMDYNRGRPRMHGGKAF